MAADNLPKSYRDADLDQHTTSALEGNLDRQMAVIEIADCDSHSGTESIAAHERLASDMQKRCSVLLEELEQFQSYLKEKKKEHAVDFKTFRNEVKNELARLKELPMRDSKRSTQYLSSCNLPFFEAVWSTAKGCSGVTAIAAIGKRVYRVPEQWGPNGRSGGVFINSRGPKDDAGARSQSYVAMVDIVSENDSEWIKVSTITERRMLFDLAKSGWVEGSSSDESEDEEKGVSKNDPEPEGLLKIAEDLVKVSQSIRIRYQHPKVRLVLPRIHMARCNKEVANVLERIRDLGVVVQTSEDLPEAPIKLASVLEQLTANRFNNFTETLNVDCTVLLAFISDLSHDSVESKDWHNRMIAHQIEMEIREPLLPSALWPACGARKLLCTREAADRMLEIVEIIGTETEKKRASLLSKVSPGTSNWTPEQRRKGFQDLSKYPVPVDWSLPIEVVDVDQESIKATLPSVVDDVSKTLKGLNSSVFLYGWGSGYTTISSNGTVARDIEKTIEENRTNDCDMGPDIWLCPGSRSLVGKEKDRRGATP